MTPMSALLSDIMMFLQHHHTIVLHLTSSMILRGASGIVGTENILLLTVTFYMARSVAVQQIIALQVIKTVL